MRINVIQFDERVRLGTFSSWLREMNITIRICRADRGELPAVEDKDPVILLGGHMGVADRECLPYLEEAAVWIANAVERGRPLLAICLGGQMLAHALGAQVTSQARQERGIQQITLTEEGCVDPLFAGLPNRFVSFEWHNDSFDLPDGGTHLARSGDCEGQAFRYKNAWGVQFHPEVEKKIVAEWCQRANVGVGALEFFRQHQVEYYAHSKRLLENFVALSQKLQGEGCIRLCRETAKDVRS